MWEKGDWFGKALTVLLIALIITLIGAVIYGTVDTRITEKQEMERYNKGICPVCGEEFRFVEAVESNTQITYVLLCENCGNIATIGEKQWDKTNSPTP